MMNPDKESKARKYDLEERLIDFSIVVMDLVEALPKTRVGNHIAGQLIRCGTSPAPNYGEAQGAESRSDFIHKIKIVLKELREVRVWVLLINRKRLLQSAEKLTAALRECNELISIFVASIGTAQKIKGK
jgi:four helix bundle protein